VTQVIISYRREDTGWITGRIFDRLEAHFGRNNVFMDVDAILEGVDFRQHIKTSLARCDALVAVIGPKWIGDRPEGRPRIWDENDWLRIEVETALAKAVPVIPVLIDRSPLPPAEALPESIQQLVFIQAAQVDSQRDFNTHMERLIRRLDQLTGSTGVRPQSQVPAAIGLQDGKAAEESSAKRLVGKYRLFQPTLFGGRVSWAVLLIFVALVAINPIVLWHKQILEFLGGSGCLRWVPAKDGIVPTNAIIGGHEPSWPLYVCRALVMGDTLPGKLIPDAVCDIAHDNRELSMHDYEALTGNGCAMQWDNAPGGTIPSTAVEGGTESGKPVFICRATVIVGTGGVHVGRSGISTAGKCLVSYGGGAYSYETFEVLTQPKQ
jgi:Protein of unknown function (DUF3421)/TIR domain